MDRDSELRARSWLAGLDQRSQELFEQILKTVFRLLTFLLIVALIGGVIRFFLELDQLWKTPDIRDAFTAIVTDMLTLFVLVELLRSLVDYYTHHRLRMTFILDAAMVFVLRELMIQLYNHGVSGSDLFPMAVLILVLGLVRTATMLVFQQEQRLGAKPESRTASAED